jgi:hypothetical protein
MVNVISVIKLNPAQVASSILQNINPDAELLAGISRHHYLLEIITPPPG